MSSSDNFEAIKTAPFCDAIEKLDEFMIQDRKVFLIGAGCSKCAGLPLIGELTNKVLKNGALAPKTQNIFEEIQTSLTDKSHLFNIEDYLSEIIDLLSIAERRAKRGAGDNQVINGKPYSAQQLRESVEEIKQTISTIIEHNDEKINLTTHQEFVKAVHRPMRPGKTNYHSCVDYLCLNYDTLLEDALALEKIPFSDGLEGGATGWWEPSVFNRKGLSAKVLKLHGSINWHSFGGDPLPRRVASSINLQSDEDKRILIWPASTKYRETQRDPYAQLAELGRKALKAGPETQKILIVCGYGFRDSHINFEINQALHKSEGHLTVVVFTSDDEPQGHLKNWHDDSTITDQILIFAKRGFFHGKDEEKSKEDLPWWKFECLTQLLKGER